ncbi:hypothetical protein HRbin01_01882 [archaeon HR01]|nr:hypothetical protein HRbin01_01882 [archaeon HR01]
MPERHELVVSRIVLDVLKPHTPTIIEFAKSISAVKGISRVDVSILEVDTNTETVKLVVEGAGINFEQVEAAVKHLGAAIHSVDQVVVEKISK